MEYKKHYSEEEINDVRTWFETHKDHLPDTLQMDKATFIKNLNHTVSLYLDIAEKHKDNETYAAQIHHLFMMRDAIREQWSKDNVSYE